MEVWKDKMTILYVAMILAGVAAVAWGLPAAHRLRGSVGVLAAVAVLAGVILFLLGILLLSCPVFSRGRQKWKKPKP